MLFQLCEGRTTNVESSFRIDVENCAKTIWRQLFRRAKKVSGRTVHDDVDLAELLDCLRNRLLDFLRLPHITGNRNGLPTAIVDRLRRWLQVVQLATDERYGSARFCQRTRNATRPFKIPSLNMFSLIILIRVIRANPRPK